MTPITPQNLRTPHPPISPLNNDAETEKTQKIFNRAIKNSDPFRRKVTHASSLEPFRTKPDLKDAESDVTPFIQSDSESDSEVSSSEFNDEMFSFVQLPDPEEDLSKYQPKLPRHPPKPPQKQAPQAITEAQQNSNRAAFSAVISKALKEQIKKEKFLKNRLSKRQVSFSEEIEDLFLYQDYKALKKIIKKVDIDPLDQTHAFKVQNKRLLTKLGRNTPDDEDFDHLFFLNKDTDPLNQTHAFKVQNGRLLAKLGRTTPTEAVFEHSFSVSKNENSLKDSPEEDPLFKKATKNARFYSESSGYDTDSETSPLNQSRFTFPE